MINIEDFDEITGEVTYKIEKDKFEQLKKDIVEKEAKDKGKKRVITLVVQIFLAILIVLIIIAFILGCMRFKEIIFPQSVINNSNNIKRFDLEKLFLYTGLMFPNSASVYSVSYPIETKTNMNITRSMLNVFTLNNNQNFSFELSKIANNNNFELIIYKYPSNEIVASFYNTISSNCMLQAGTYYMIFIQNDDLQPIIKIKPNTKVERKVIDVNLNDNISDSIEKMESLGYSLAQSYNYSCNILNKISNNLQTIKSGLIPVKKNQFVVIDNNFEFNGSVKFNGENILKFVGKNKIIMENKNIDGDFSIDCFKVLSEKGSINVYIFE